MKERRNGEGVPVTVWTMNWTPVQDTNCNYDDHKIALIRLSENVCIYTEEVFMVDYLLTLIDPMHTNPLFLFLKYSQKNNPFLRHRGISRNTVF